MRVHRTAHRSRFTVFPNEMLQQVGLRNAPRGLLTFLLSLPDECRMTAKQMARTTGDSLYSTRRSLRELTAAGYYIVVRIKLPNGRFNSVQHVTDTPHQFGPGDGFPAPGSRAPSKTKKPSKETPLPPLLPEPPVVPRPRTETPPPAAPKPPAPRRPAPVLDGRARAAADTLLRVVRSEPRLRIGEAEAARLAPLVMGWIDRGSSASDLAAALLPGLPEHVHSPTGFLHRRLTDKLPATFAPQAPVPVCDSCRNPVPRPGLCAPCAQTPPPAPITPGTGPALAREALRRARAAAS
ncbi:hypothetical protein [Kitasatospora phosalacinea]|uniref:DNA-binding protein n=1 Tax=Kitasatospora phosalacinea TaxID=2065 RepID=A0A9W6PDL1_9ACTN|nr:hypothetical protein [Kitasatospora phosalacinea]GLW53002.1 DNA-binding protein [Kitasatospora phosalacinea]